MLKLFKKEVPVQESAWRAKLRQWTYQHKLRLAEAISIQERKMSLRQKKFGFIAFCLLFGSASGYCLYAGIFLPAKSPAMQLESMPVPHFHQKEHVGLTITREDTLQMIAFRQLMDSLSSTGTGRKILEEIDLERPGFRDSMMAMTRQFTK